MSTVVVPWTESPRPHRNAAAITTPLTTTSAIPVSVVRVSSVPPSAPKAMPAREAPSISGTALAATLEKRDTEARQLRQDWDSCQRGHALAQGRGAARHREQREQYQRDQQRQRHLVGGAGEVEEPAAVGREARAAHVDGGRVPLAVGECGEVAGVLRPRGRLARRIGGSHTGAA